MAKVRPTIDLMCELNAIRWLRRMFIIRLMEELVYAAIASTSKQAKYTVLKTDICL